MNAEDFIELAEYLKENYVSKDGSLEIELYRVLSSIEERPVSYTHLTLPTT